MYYWGGSDVPLVVTGVAGLVPAVSPAVLLDGLLPVTLGVDGLTDPDGDDGLNDSEGVGGLTDADGVDGLIGVDGLVGVTDFTGEDAWSFCGVLGLGDVVFTGDTAFTPPLSTLLLGVAGLLSASLSADLAGDLTVVRGFINLVLVINSTGFCSACHVPTNDPHGDLVLLGMPCIR